LHSSTREAHAGAPPAASVGDEEKLTEVREVQSNIRTQLGERKETNAGDKAVILGQYEVDGAKVLSLWDTAMSNMDQGKYL